MTPRDVDQHPAWTLDRSREALPRKQAGADVGSTPRLRARHFLAAERRARRQTDVAGQKAPVEIHEAAAEDEDVVETRREEVVRRIQEEAACKDCWDLAGRKEDNQAEVGPLLPRRREGRETRLDEEEVVERRKRRRDFRHRIEKRRWDGSREVAAHRQTEGASPRGGKEEERRRREGEKRRVPLRMSV